MNIRILKQNVAMLCISLVLAASAQPALAGTVLPDPVLLYETELSLLADPDQTEPITSIAGTIHQGGPFTMRSFYLMVPDGAGGGEYLAASYAWTDEQDDVRVTISAGGEVYSFINFLKNRGEADDFFTRYLDLYHLYYGNGADGEPASPLKPGSTTAERMMHFFTWLDEQLLIAGDREYGFARKFAWMQSDAYARLIPHAAGLLSQVVYAQEAKVDNAWVKAITFQDLSMVFDYPVKRVLDREIPIPGRNEMESFSLGIVPLESNQPAGGFFGWEIDDYIDCWNETWSGMDCRTCCNDWYSVASAICAVLAFINPVAGAACLMTATTGYAYCRIGCSLANPGLAEGWLGGA